MPIKTKPQKPVGNKAFRELFDRIAHSDDWGVPCVYDYAGWKIWQAAIRYERKRRAQSESGNG
jgi:hypothetical protein